MQRYQAIFKYAVLVNVALALYVTARGAYVIWDHHEALEQWARWLASDRGEFGFDHLVQPRNHILVFAWVLIVDAVILAAATIYGVWRNGRWADWARIFAFLAIWFVAWLEGLGVLAFIFDIVPSWDWHTTWAALKALAVPVFACIWLVYNIVYRAHRTDADAPTVSAQP
ncbi:MAG TPA: hypothetical protein VEC11_17980 [Allosphingosinicella sp.]|nr:hypothetical protein [Allosphingosinicella sp.]